jgi:hypothetical protein
MMTSPKVCLNATNTSSIFQSSITTPATSFSQVALKYYISLCIYDAKHTRVSFVKVLSSIIFVFIDMCGKTLNNT